MKKWIKRSSKKRNKLKGVKRFLTNPNLKHGWYSPSHAYGGYVTYRLAKSRELVDVTEISSKPTPVTSRYGDLKYVGIIDYNSMVRTSIKSKIIGNLKE